MFCVGFLGWTWDAFDFFTVSLCITEIAKDFGVENSDVSWVQSTIWSISVTSIAMPLLTSRVPGPHLDAHAAIRRRLHLRLDVGSLRAQMAHDHQSVLVYCPRDVQWVLQYIRAIPGREKFVRYCDGGYVFRSYSLEDVDS